MKKTWSGSKPKTADNQPIPTKCKTCNTPVWKIINLGLVEHLDTNPIPANALPAAQATGRTVWKLKQIGHTFTAHWYWHTNHTNHNPTTPTKPNQTLLLQHHCTYPATHPEGHPDYWPTTGHQCKEGQCDY